MARKKRDEDEIEVGEQMDLIDVKPENLNEIKPVAKKYRAAVKRRMKALEDEIQLKGEILELVKAADLKPLDNGVIRFKCDGMTITITPRDMLVKVKDESGDDD